MNDFSMIKFHNLDFENIYTARDIMFLVSKTSTSILVWNNGKINYFANGFEVTQSSNNLSYIMWVSTCNEIFLS